MDVIEIDCPRCDTPLELDAAFAGGVCRCSECGTLMAVPAASGQRAETLERPDAPPGSQPGSQSSTRADSPTSGRPDSPGGRPDSPAGRPDTPGGSAGGAIDDAASESSEIDALASTTGAAEVYVTPSGRTVHVNKHAKVPTAQRKRKVIRATAVTMLVGLTLALGIGIFIFANILFGNKDDVDKVDAIIGVNPDANPMLIEKANLIGIPVGKDAAILIDGSGFAKGWLPIMRDVVYDAVQKSPESTFLIIAWTDLGNSSYTNDKPAKIAKEELSKFRNFLDRIPTIAPALPIDAVNESLKLRMDQIVLITGQRLEESDSETIKKAVESKVDTRFDVILITDAGDHDPALEAIAKANEGQYVKVTRRKLEAWHAVWKDTSTKDSATKDGAARDGAGKKDGDAKKDGKATKDSKKN